MVLVIYQIKRNLNISEQYSVIRCDNQKVFLLIFRKYPKTYSTEIIES